MVQNPRGNTIKMKSWQLQIHSFWYFQHLLSRKEGLYLVVAYSKG